MALAAVVSAWGTAELAGFIVRREHARRSPSAASGRALYLAYGCAACHGASGDGKGMVGRGFLPPPTDLRDASAYESGSDIASIRQSIRWGLLGENSRMPSFEHLTPEELDALADYLVSLQQAGHGQGEHL